MGKIVFQSVETPEEIRALAAMTSEIWHEYFPCILTPEQIDYMVDKFQSQGALTEQIANGYIYEVMEIGGERAGYLGVHMEPDGSLFLSKLYLKKAYRGKGYASVEFKEAQRLAKSHGASSIWLTVNKHNTQAIAVYEHFGMENIRAQVTDIGGGFVMDDFVFSLSL